MICARAEDQVLDRERIDGSDADGGGHGRYDGRPKDAGEEEDQTADHTYFPGEDRQTANSDAIGQGRHGWD